MIQDPRFPPWKANHQTTLQIFVEDKKQELRTIRKDVEDLATRKELD